MAHDRTYIQGVETWDAIQARRNVRTYTDQPILTEDIQKVDEIYLWFVRVKEASIAQRP